MTTKTHKLPPKLVEKIHELETAFRNAIEHTMENANGDFSATVNALTQQFQSQRALLLQGFAASLNGEKYVFDEKEMTLTGEEPTKRRGRRKKTAE